MYNRPCYRAKLLLLCGNTSILATITAFTGISTAKAPNWADNAPLNYLSRKLIWLRTLGKYTDPRLSRQEDNDAKAPVEIPDDEIPLFEDEDSVAWASFSLNVAIARKSLSSVQVRTF